MKGRTVYIIGSVHWFLIAIDGIGGLSPKVDRGLKGVMFQGRSLDRPVPNFVCMMCMCVLAIVISPQ